MTYKEKLEFTFGIHVHVEHIFIFIFDIAWLARKNRSSCFVSMCMLSISLFLDLTSHDLQGNQKIVLHVSLFTYCWFSGTSSSTGRFFASSAVIASHEDTKAWSSIYRYVSSLNINPTFHLADGAKAITKAIDEVLCPPHVLARCA